MWKCLIELGKKKNNMSVKQISKTIWEMKRVNGISTVCQFNDGYSHIGIDDHCWLVLNGGKKSAWIFPEAVAILKALPSSPDEYQPWRDFVGMVS